MAALHRDSPRGAKKWAPQPQLHAQGCSQSPGTGAKWYTTTQPTQWERNCDNVLRTARPSSSNLYEMKSGKSCILVITFSPSEGIQAPGYLVC